LISVSVVRIVRIVAVVGIIVGIVVIVIVRIVSVIVVIEVWKTRGATELQVLVSILRGVELLIVHLLEGESILGYQNSRLTSR